MIAFTNHEAAKENAKDVREALKKAGLNIKVTTAKRSDRHYTVIKAYDAGLSEQDLKPILGETLMGCIVA